MEIRLIKAIRVPIDICIFRNRIAPKKIARTVVNVAIKSTKGLKVA